MGMAFAGLSLDWRVAVRGLLAGIRQSVGGGPPVSRDALASILRRLSRGLRGPAMKPGGSSYGSPCRRSFSNLDIATIIPSFSNSSIVNI
jgi:hypothetical protein